MAILETFLQNLSFFTISWFNHIIPEPILQLIGQFSLLLVGYLVEQNYVGRVVTFSNAVALNLFLYTRSPKWYLALYANLAAIFGVLGISAYGTGFSLHSGYYTLNWFFSSFAVGIVMIAVVVI